jgi:hypothetical protein
MQQAVRRYVMTAFCSVHTASEKFAVRKPGDKRNQEVVAAYRFGADVQLVELECGQKVNLVLGRRLSVWR